MVRPGLVAAATLWMCGMPSLAAARTEDETIRMAHDVLQEFQRLQIRQIPESLLAEAHAVAIIPSTVKVGFVVGGQRGRGVVVVRERDGSWRAPLFVTMTGGSIGWQIGAQATDFVLVFRSQTSVDGLLRGKFTLGADAAVAAGPVGRRAGAATDAELRAEIFTYSRSRGLFAGVSLEGSALQVDHAANAAFYGPMGNGPTPPEALRLVEIVAGLTNPTVAAAGNPGGPAVTPGGIPVPAEGFAPSGGVAPAVAGQPGPMFPPVAVTGASHLEEVRAPLVRAATELSPLLDESWREFLALPADVFKPGVRPSTAAVEAALGRFNEVARNRKFAALTDRPQFHETHRLLQALAEDLRASGGPVTGLPRPPVGR